MGFPITTLPHSDSTTPIRDMNNIRGAICIMASSTPLLPRLLSVEFKGRLDLVESSLVGFWIHQKVVWEMVITPVGLFLTPTKR